MSMDINNAIGNVEAIRPQVPVNPVKPAEVDDTNRGGMATAYGNQEGRQQASEVMLQSAADDLNEKLAANNIQCEFKYHSDINRVSIKLVDSTTKEVVREIPSEDTLAMIKKMTELTGLIIDEKR